MVFLYLEVVCGVNRLAKTAARGGSHVFRYYFRNGNEDLGMKCKISEFLL
jgi:hypothetical protein